MMTICDQVNDDVGDCRDDICDDDDDYDDDDDDDDDDVMMMLMMMMMTIPTSLGTFQTFLRPVEPFCW